MYNLIVALLSVTALQVWSVQAGTYTFTCSPNNTISISGLPTNLTAIYYYAVQSTGLNCTVTGNKAAGTAEINGCEKDLPIYLTYSSYDMFANQIQGGTDVEILNITCYEISATGVADSISNTLDASILFGDEKSINVTYDVTSALNVSSADIGDPVEWTIYLPSVNYTLQITSCSAYPGTDDTSSHSVLLITDWCSDEDALITDFDTNSLNTEASAVIQAFKFFDVDNIFLKCDLKVCPTPTSCIDSCQSRKKRALTSRDDNDAYKTRVSKVLHINGPDTSSAVRWSGVGLLLTSVLSAAITAVKYC